MLYRDMFDNNIELETGLRECAFDDPMEATLNNILESEQNWNAINQTLGLGELKHYCENGEYKIYSEADTGSFVQTIKRGFIAVIEKLKGLFVKFKATIMKLFANDKAFVKKYKKDVIGKSISYKGYKFTTSNFSLKSNFAAAKSAVDGFTKNDVSDLEDTYSSLRGKIAGGGNKYTASEFTKELYNKFRNGQTSKEDQKFDGSTQMSIIENAKGLINSAGKLLTEITSGIKGIISDVERQSKEEVSKDNANADKVAVLSEKVKGYRAIVKMAQIANGAYLSALKAERAQAKTICVKLIGKKRESNDESASLFDISDNVSDLLSSVKLI